MNEKMKGLIGVFAIILLSGTMGYSEVEPLASTPLGKLRGTWMTSRSGRKFNAFLGVPFAKPPVGDLVFQPPEPLESWNGIRDAKKNGPWCIQYNLYDLTASVVGELDCLYLSVYSHNLNGKAPVMVHLHGGGFISGTGPNFTGPEYLMDKDVVIVNINYRVGVFGFLSFEDKDLPGNQGMKDQVMALKWVQQNIRSFGGDPNRVTLVGESAGAGSVYHHTVSPLSKGLFHGGIAESGSSYGLWSVAPVGFTRNLAMKLLASLNCSYTTTKEAVECIKRKDPKEVAAKLEIFREWQIDPIFNFGPVFEEAGPGAFLVGPISSWKHADVPLLTGITSGEGLLRTQYFYYLNTTYEWLSENFDRIAPASLLYFASASNPNEITRAVRQYYFPNGQITENDWVNLTNMYSDSWITYAVIEGANKHTGSVHFYYFDYVGDVSFGGNSTVRNDSVMFGAPHTEEMFYIWNLTNYNNLKGKDLELSKKLVTIWTDFAKHGTPAPKGCGIHWEKWTADRHRYIHISKKGFNLEEGLIEDRFNFWKSINFRDKYD